MAQRIRYSKTDQENILRSVKSFDHPTNGGRFYVVLDNSTHSFQVWDERADAMVTSGSAETAHAVRIAAKEALSNLGIEFNNEERSGKVKGTKLSTETTTQI